MARKPKPEDEARAWMCRECEALQTAEEHEAQPLFECADCGSRFTREGSADGQGNRCPDCNKFGRKLTEHCCPECEEAEMVPLVQHPAFVTAEF